MVKLKTSWLGMALNASDGRLYVSGGTRSFIEVLAYDVGQRAAALPPLTQMGRNDLGSAMIVEAASRCSLWPKMAIFVVEDDTQNGPDHVDAHCTIAYVISPY
jgi:hypothetical protein